MINCENCGCSIPSQEERWVYDNVYCDSCYSQNYTHCNRCDTVIHREDANYDEDDIPFCDDCYFEGTDYNAPDNPSVDDADRELILTLCRDWLADKLVNRYALSIRQSDPKLPEIKAAIGLVEKKAYLFGLADRAEYQISVSQDYLAEVQHYIRTRALPWKITLGTGYARIGIALSLRQNETEQVIEMIKWITSVRERSGVLCAG